MRCLTGAERGQRSGALAAPSVAMIVWSHFITLNCEGAKLSFKKRFARNHNPCPWSIVKNLLFDFDGVRERDLAMNEQWIAGSDDGALARCAVES